MKRAPYLHSFQERIENISLPEKFTFPFYYSPSEISQLAAQQLQAYLQTQEDFAHTFFPNSADQTPAIGKMFGVLVVKTKDHQLGFLAAFSGKLAGTNSHDYFVPPIFDMLTLDSFFLEGEKELKKMNISVLKKELSPQLRLSKKRLNHLTATAAFQIEQHREKMRQEKARRKQRRIHADQNLSTTEREELEKKLIRESILLKNELKELTSDFEEKIARAKSEYENELAPIHRLKQLRKEKSQALQQKLFDQYNFLNIEGEQKNVQDIFSSTIFKKPPSGAGECAAPKLLQYAFLNDLIPISMAEFWWGTSPSSEIRKHNHFYPSCKGKCEPILGHMLTGIELDPNPMLENPGINSSIEIVYEDDDLAVINKPSGLLSVPGKTITDSVYSRMKAKYPDSTGPIIVHRLDMSTSGLMVISKSKKSNEILQKQFIDRVIKKKYTALLDGEIHSKKGNINLPLRLDINDRPRQLVCHEHGKPSKTIYKVLQIENGQTRIEFHPITGRTHQLRVHAAHPHGLNTPIIGDDLYGKSGTRLHLHAQYLQFIHPTTGEKKTFEISPEF